MFQQLNLSDTVVVNSLLFGKEITKVKECVCVGLMFFEIGG